MVTLDRVDPAYAAELEARSNGLTVVLPEPENSVSLAIAGAWSPRDRVPDAASPTWVTVEKPRLS